MVKNLSAVQKTQVWSLSQEDPMEKRMDTHSSICAWKNPMDRGIQVTEKLGYSPLGHKESDTTELLTLSLFTQFLYTDKSMS